MTLELAETTVGKILTRTTGYLRTITSHSLQPYRGCTFGRSLCGAGCYVRHNQHLLKGREWGGFLDVRTNAAESYRRQYAAEARWARSAGRFSIFCSSATDPFVPQEFRYGITRSILEEMLERPPDELILQTHSHRVVDYLDLYRDLREKCALRFHLSIESDRDRLPGLPPPASSVDQRFEACARLREAGLRVVVTTSPLLPIDDPEAFFGRIADVADAVVLDHFIRGDGSPGGERTWRTALPEAMAAVLPESVSAEYCDRMIEVARRHLPGRVGWNIDGFAGRFVR